MRLSEVRDRAEQMVGVHEDPSPPYPQNHVSISAECDKVWWLGFSRQNQQWCGTFVDLLLGKAMMASSVFSVPYGVQHFKAAGRFTQHPEPGFVCFMSFTADRYPGHVGWVNHVVSQHVVDNIEGNTQPGVRGQQANGGGVFPRTRFASAILGYGVITYAPEQEIPVLEKLLKCAEYQNVFAVYSSGIVRGLYGPKELTELLGKGYVLDDDASKSDIERLALLAGPGSGVLVPTA